MSWLGFGGGGGEQKEESGESIVRKLSSRIESATLLDDRRDSVRAIRSLSRKYRREVTDIAMGNLIELIKTESDTECLATAIEAICSLVCADEEDFEEGEVRVAKETSIQLSKSNHLLTLFLDCFDKSEFKVKWAALRLLNALAREYPNILQQVIQERPTGVSALVDCVSSSNELLRNTTLLLLINVAENNPILQKIIVFENCFEILLNVSLSEGGIHSSPVSEDCLSLLLILLDNNQSNVTFFCETALIPKLIEFIVSLDQDPNNWSEGKIQCGLLYLRVIRALVSPSLPTNVSTPSRRTVRNCSLLSLLLKLIMGSGVPEIILTEIIITVAESIRGFPESQKDFQILEAPLNPPKPAMVVLLMSMVNSKQPLSLRLAVLYCTACWLYKNPEAQSELVDTLLPSDAPAAGCLTAGQLLCGALFSPDPTTSWLAACALSHAILNQKENQEKLVRVQLAPGPNQPPTSLSAQLELMLSQSASPHTRLGILQFLSCWCTDSTHACQVLLQEGKLVSTLQLLINGQPNDPVQVLIHGVACFLLGLLGISDQSDVVVTEVRKRPGPDSFLDKMAQVGKSGSYQSAAGNACPTGNDPEELQIFNAFTAVYRKHEAAIGRHVAQFEDIQAEIAEKREKNEKIKQLEAQLGDQQAMVAKIEDLESQIAALQTNEQNSESKIDQIQNNIPEEMKGEIDIDEIKRQLAVELADGVKKDIEENMKEEVRETLSQQIRPELEQEVLSALELEVEERVRAKILEEMEAEKTALQIAISEQQAKATEVDQSRKENEEFEANLKAKQVELETKLAEVQSTNAIVSNSTGSEASGMLTENSLLQQQLQQQQEQLEEEKATLYQQQQAFAQQQQQLQEQQQQQQQFQQQLNHLQSQLQLEQQKIEEKSAELESKQNQFRLDQEQLASQVASPAVAKSAGNQPAEKAETDGQPLEQEKISQLEQENANFKEIIQELEQELEIEKNNVIEERQRTQSSETNKEQHISELAESSDRIVNMEYEIKQLESKLATATEANNNFETIVAQRMATIQNMEHQLSKWELGGEEKNQQINNLNKHNLELEKQIDALKQKISNPVVPKDVSTIQTEYDELKKDQDDLLELLSDQQLKIGEYRDRLRANDLPVTDEEDMTPDDI